MLSENFLFLILIAAFGMFIALFGSAGCLWLSLKGKDGSTGSLQVGKLLNVQGVSLILTASFGLLIVGGCVYAWVRLNQVADYDYGFGFYDEAWEEEPMELEELGYLDEPAAEEFSVVEDVEIAGRAAKWRCSTSSSTSTTPWTTTCSCRSMPSSRV